MSSSVSDENLEKKFQGVTNTQDSIQTLSLWLLHHKVHHQKIVTSWMKVLKKGNISIFSPLTIFLIMKKEYILLKKENIKFLNFFSLTRVGSLYCLCC